MTATVPVDRAPARTTASRLALAGVVAVLALGVAAALSLALGTRAVPLDTIVAALFGADGSDSLVVRDLRVPLTVIGLVAGAALGMAGAVMQSVTRNPIADPGLLGVNAGASLGVVAAITLLGISSPWATVWFALGGAAVAAAIVMGVAASSRAGATPVTLALAGAALTAVLISLVHLVLLTDLRALDQYRFWSVGSLVSRGLDDVVPVLPIVLVAAVVALLLGRGLDALALGDESATSVGLRAPVVRTAALVAAVMLGAGATAIAGPLLFVGLVVPHLARALVGARSTAVLAVSAPLGGALVLFADVLGRFAAPPGELEVGIVVAFLGAPVLVGLVRSGRAR